LILEAQVKSKACVNLLLFVSFALASLPQATGIAVHEWLSVLVLLPLMVHLLSDWQWIARTLRQLFGRLPSESRFNLIWDSLLFINVVVVIVSGLMISEAVVPLTGSTVEIDRFWTVIHDFSSNLILAMLGVHLALHWAWISNVTRRLLFRRGRWEPERTEEQSLRESTLFANAPRVVLTWGLRLGVILLVAAAITSVVWPIQFTLWAETLRNQEEEHEMASLSPSLRILAIASKQLATVLGPALITAGTVRLIARRKRRLPNSLDE